MTMFQKYMRILILGLVYASGMALPYIHFKFYDIIRTAINVTNTEFGTLMTTYILISMCFYIPGGVIADKFSPKKTLIACSLVTAICHFIFALWPSYTTALMLWSVLAISTVGVFWPCLVKAVRDTGDTNEQGRMFGTFFGAQGLVMVIIGFTGAAVYANFENSMDGFRNMLYAQSAFLILSCVLVLFFFKDKTEYNQNLVATKDASVVGNLKHVIKTPGVWLMSLLIFCGYGLYVGVGYMTPYTTNVLGVSITMGAVLGTLRVYGIRIFTGPLSGYIVDKLGSASKLMVVSFVALIGMLLLLLNLPLGASSNLIITITMLISFCCMMLYCVMFATMDEVSIPVEYTATATSVVSMLGYFPDAIFPPLFGYWVDVYGAKTGYTITFFFLTGLAVLGLGIAIIIYRVGAKKKAATANESSVANATV